MVEIKFNLIIRVRGPEDDRDFVSDEIGLLLREIAEIGEQSVRGGGSNSGNVWHHVKHGSYRWERTPSP